MLSLAARPMDSTVSFHGRTVRRGGEPVQGAITTAQAIPENLILGNLGLEAETTPIQGIMLTLGLIVLWASRRWRRPDAPAPRSSDAATTVAMSAPTAAGRRPGARVAHVRVQPAGMHRRRARAGQLPGGVDLPRLLRYRYLRTHNMYTIVPWYDVIPQIGAVLFVVGWWSGPRRRQGRPWRADRPGLAEPLRGLGCWC